MAVDMFMEMGDIKGETQDKEFKSKGGIDVLSWSWGMSQSGTLHAGEGGGSGKANFNDISFTKWVDKASPKLMLALAKGTHITECKLTCRKAGEAQQKYIEITLKPCLITSLSTGGSGGEDRLTENVTLNFKEVAYQYYVQDEKGNTKLGGEFGWDIAANASSKA